MRSLQMCVAACLIFLVPTSAFGTSYIIKTEAAPSWRTIGPQDPLAFENANPGWMNDLAYDDSDAAGWSAADFVRLSLRHGEDYIWEPNRRDVAYFRHVFSLDGPVLSAVLDGVIDDDGQIYVNGTLVWDDHSGNYTPFDNIDLAPLLTPGDNLIAVKAVDVGGLEGLTAWLPIETIPEPATLALPLDIKPGSCPNPLNLKSRGKLPVALLGTENFDVSTIDPASITLARADGVGGYVTLYDGPPGPKVAIQDVGTPFGGELCDCHEVDGDGIDDLSIKFSRPEVVAALQLREFDPGATVELVVSGVLWDGTLFSATDCILIVPQADFDEDNDVDQSDFGHLQACYRGPMKKVTDLACQDADIDGDGDVDISDFGRLQRCISGAAKAVNPRCAD